LVVIHDARVERTTEGSGAVSDKPLAQLQALDAGYHWPFAGDARPWRGKGLAIPVLDDVLRRFSGVLMNIEIKTEHESVAAELCEMLTEHGALQSTLVASFHTNAMARFRSTCPAALTSAYRNEVLRFFGHHVLGLTRMFHADAHALQLSEQIWGIDVLRSSTLDSAHDRNMLVHAWTINDEAAMRRYVAMGIDGIITDDPGLLIEVLAAADP